MKPRLARHARLRFDRIENKHLLLSPERGLVLNATAAAILALCDGVLTVEEIGARLKERYPDARLSEVESFLGRLRARGLVEG